MKTFRVLALLGLAALLILTVSCKKKGPEPPSDIEAFSADTMEKVVSTDMVAVDNSVFTEGKGSLKITLEQPATVRLYEVAFPQCDNANLVYKVKMKAKDFGGDAYLQMVVHFPSGGEMTMDNYQAKVGGPMGGTMDWTAQELTAPIRKGQKPDSVKLNLILNGGGTVWVDDIHLVKVPQPEK